MKLCFLFDFSINSILLDFTVPPHFGQPAPPKCEFGVCSRNLELKESDKINLPILGSEFFNDLLLDVAMRGYL